MKHPKLLAAAAGALAVATLVAPAATAATSGDTDATFTLTGGFLSITVPAGPVSLGAATTTLLSGVEASGSLGETTVSDTRNATTGWAVSAGSTAFTQTLDGSGAVPASPASVANTNVGIVVPAGSVVQNIGGLFTPTAGTTGDAGGVIGQTVGDLTGLLGLLDTTNEVSYDPTITVTVPAGTPDGTYQGTITQTVAGL